MNEEQLDSVKRRIKKSSAGTKSLKLHSPVQNILPLV